MFDWLKKFGIITPSKGNTALDTKKGNNVMSAYTPVMISALEASAPLNLAKAKALAEKFPTVSYRSIISKAKSLGIDYEKAAPATKKAKSNEPTKAAILGSIRTALDLPEREGDLTKTELEAVLANLG